VYGVRTLTDNDDRCTRHCRRAGSRWLRHSRRPRRHAVRGRHAMVDDVDGTVLHAENTGPIRAPEFGVLDRENWVTRQFYGARCSPCWPSGAPLAFSSHGRTNRGSVGAHPEPL